MTMDKLFEIRVYETRDMVNEISEVVFKDEYKYAWVKARDLYKANCKKYKDVTVVIYMHSSFTGEIYEAREFNKKKNGSLTPRIYRI